MLVVSDLLMLLRASLRKRNWCSNWVTRSIQRRRIGVFLPAKSVWLKLIRPYRLLQFWHPRCRSVLFWAIDFLSESLLKFAWCSFASSVFWTWCCSLAAVNWWCKSPGESRMVVEHMIPWWLLLLGGCLSPVPVSKQKVLCLHRWLCLCVDNSLVSRRFVHNDWLGVL